MKFYYATGSCSLVVRFLLLHAGAMFDAMSLDLEAGEQHEPVFLSLNPKGKVPVIVRDDGWVLTEIGTISTWIATTHPRARLIPDELDARIRVQETLEYCISTIHALGVLRIFAARAFGDANQEAAIKTKGKEILSQGLHILNQRLSASGYVAESVSIADFMLFWITMGAKHSGLELPGNIAKHYDTLRGLPAVEQGLIAEGLA
jgi:glutathione S-transferase